MLPKPTYTGGVPASRNASSSAGSGRSSGRIHAPVCTTSRSAGSCHGPRTGSAASHGRSVKTWSRTLSTGGRPIDARWALIGSPNSAFRLWAFRSHSARLSVTSGGTAGQQRRVVRRRQPERTVGRVHVADAQFLGHRLRAGHGRGQAGRHQRVTSLGRRGGDRVELRGDQLGGARSAAVGGFSVGSHPAHHLAYRRAGRHQRHADPGQQLRECPAARTPAPPRRAPATAPRAPPSARRPRATRTSTTTHAFRLPRFRSSGLGRRFCGMTGVLPQAPRCAIT